MNPLRFVLFHRRGEPTPEERARLVKCPGLQVLDDSGRALLVLATMERIVELRHDFPDWTISEERIHPAPSPDRPGRRDSEA